MIGLPGAGKTTVAQRAAALLGAQWCDLDEMIEATAGKRAAEIIESEGEPVFRALERAAMHDALSAPPQVIASGGGWASEPGNVADAELRALLIYLSADPSVAARRVGSAAGRPLLGGGAVEDRVAALLAARERWYRLAAVEVATDDAGPDAVAEGVAAAARQYGGW